MTVPDYLAAVMATAVVALTVVSAVDIGIEVQVIRKVIHDSCVRVTGASAV